MLQPPSIPHELCINIPILQITPPSKCWNFSWDTRPMAAFLDAIPPEICSVIRRVATNNILSTAESWSFRTESMDIAPPDQRPRADDGSGWPANGVRYSLMRLSLGPSPRPASRSKGNGDSDWALKLAGMDAGPDGKAGWIVPLAELDLLCLLLHDVLCAGRRRTARYLRVWRGGGDRALVVWETERGGGTDLEVRRVDRTTCTYLFAHRFGRALL